MGTNFFLSGGVVPVELLAFQELVSREPVDFHPGVVLFRFTR